MLVKYMALETEVIIIELESFLLCFCQMFAKMEKLAGNIAVDVCALFV